MGDDLSLPERRAVRTVMQWNDGRNGGFSEADPGALPRPVIRGGDYGFEVRNVEAQRRDPDSLLNWMERAIRARKGCPEIGRGEVAVLESDVDAVFAHACTLGEGTVVAVHNLSDADVRVAVDLSRYEGDRLVDVIEEGGSLPFQPKLGLELGRYGYRWLRIVRD